MRAFFHILFLSLASLAHGTLDFNRDVRPILSDKCFACHGPDEEGRKADLRLDIESEAKNDNLMAIVSGSPEDSEMIYRIHSVEEDELMPPPEIGKPLTQKEKEILEQWIKEGAAWADHWAYVPPVDHPTPEVKDKQWSTHWIDPFALAAIEKRNLRPAKEADPVTLVRRLHFDLTGLPPAPEVVQSFASDPSEQAYSRIIEDILDSPHFGERLATYWLDLVRYADTVGYHGDQPHNISPYRDWVIQAFNNNMPFDQFTREQLAGDLLPGSTTQQKVASGYNRLLQTTHEGGLQLKEYDAIYAADRVRNVSEVWMGATVGCAQCHDHKYDPYTIKDHYALASFFSDLGDRGFNGNSLPTKRPPEIQIFSPEQQARIDSLTQEITKALPREIVLGINALDHNRTQFTSQLRKAKNNKKAPWKKKLAELEPKYLELTDQASIDRYRELVGKKKKVENQGIWTMVSRAVKPRTMRVLPRGNWMDDSGPVVLPSVPEFLGSIQSDKETTVPARPRQLAYGHRERDRSTQRPGAWPTVYGISFSVKAWHPTSPTLGDRAPRRTIPNYWTGWPSLLSKKTGTSKPSSETFFSAKPIGSPPCPRLGSSASRLPAACPRNSCATTLLRSADYLFPPSGDPA